MGIGQLTVLIVENAQVAREILFVATSIFSRNCPSCVRALLRRGADALAQGDSCFETPAFLSVMACAYKWAPGCLDTFRILVEEGGAEKKDILAVRYVLSPPPSFLRTMGSSLQ